MIFCTTFFLNTEAAIFLLKFLSDLKQIWKRSSEYIEFDQKFFTVVFVSFSNIGPKFSL